MIAAIPSPSTGVLHVGALQVRAYGLCIALGAVVGVRLASRRAAARGLPSGLVESISLWAIPAGIVGARIYHLVTDFGSYRGRRLEMFAIWKGGLGIWGGVALGAAVGVVVARQRRADPLRLLDVAALGIAVAQAIGRFGNWFNQELFGRPTSLPWGLRIDPSHRPDRFAQASTFHPTFLYESLWCLLIVLGVHLVERRRRLKPGQIFFGYVAMYTVGRWYFETLRVDPATRVGGFRVNELVAPFVLALALSVIVGLGRRTVEDFADRDIRAPSDLHARLQDETNGHRHSAVEHGGHNPRPVPASEGSLGSDKAVRSAAGPSEDAGRGGVTQLTRIGPPAGLMLGLVAGVILIAAVIATVLR